MAILMTASFAEHFKRQYVATPVASGVFTCATDSLAIYVGSTVPRHQAITSLTRCAEALREMGHKAPTAAQLCNAKMIVATSLKSSVVRTPTAATVTALTDNSVAIAYGTLFQITLGNSVQPFIKRLIERYLEVCQKRGIVS